MRLATYSLRNLKRRMPRIFIQAKNMRYNACNGDFRLENWAGKNESKLLETVTLGGGCFWCTEAIFREIDGVTNVKPGYSGGEISNPTYEQVSSGTTNHAEVVQITFDPAAVSFREILEVFFATHDPTTLNRQGADIGSQYRSVIFYHNDEQKSLAIKLIEELNNKNIYKKHIVTQVEPFKTFYEAEGYHRNYFKRNSEKPYCRLVIAPKVAKARMSLKHDSINPSQ